MNALELAGRILNPETVIGLRCKSCGKKLGEYVTPPYYIVCGRCKKPAEAVSRETKSP